MTDDDDECCVFVVGVDGAVGVVGDGIDEVVQGISVLRRCLLAEVCVGC